MHSPCECHTQRRAPLTTGLGWDLLAKGPSPRCPTHRPLGCHGPVHPGANEHPAGRSAASGRTWDRKGTAQSPVKGPAGSPGPGAVPRASRSGEASDRGHHVPRPLSLAWALVTLLGPRSTQGGSPVILRVSRTHSRPELPELHQEVSLTGPGTHTPKSGLWARPRWQIPPGPCGSAGDGEGKLPRMHEAEKWPHVLT